MKVRIIKGPHFEKNIEKAAAYVVECVKRDMKKVEQKKEDPNGNR